MPASVVLVTGVGGELGGRILARLGNNPDFDRVIGVDMRAPSAQVIDRMGRAEFVRADIRNPLIGQIIASSNVDTVVHAATTAHPAGPARRTSVKETNVVGTMRLLGVCQRSPVVRKLVVKSTAAVYGAGPRSPAVFNEQSPLKAVSPEGYASDAVEMEGYVRGLRRRRPDITVTVARLTNVVGPDVDTVITRYFALPLVPTVLGFDARLQFLHASDAVSVFERATLQDKPGVFNVSGGGVLTLGQAVRRAGRIGLPMPRQAITTLRPLLAGGRSVDFSRDQLQLLHYGRVVDTDRLNTEFGYTPQFSSAEAFDDFVAGRGLQPIIDPTALLRRTPLRAKA